MCGISERRRERELLISRYFYGVGKKRVGRAFFFEEPERRGGMRMVADGRKGHFMREELPTVP
jgi:hypothetical protein